jgi:casein kinase 1
LGFEEDPDYNYLRGLFKKVMEKNKLENDFEFDWVKKLNLNRSKSNIFKEIIIYKIIIFDMNEYQ